MSIAIFSVLALAYLDLSRQTNLRGHLLSRSNEALFLCLNALEVLDGSALPDTGKFVKFSELHLQAPKEGVDSIMVRVENHAPLQYVYLECPLQKTLRFCLIKELK